MLYTSAKAQSFEIIIPDSIDLSNKEEIKKLVESAEISFNNAVAFCSFEFETSYCKEGNVFFESAENDLQKLQKHLPNNCDVNYGLGISIFFSSNKYNALQYLEKARCKKYNNRSLLLFYLAKSYQLHQMWDSAITAYKSFIPIMKKENRDLKLSENEDDLQTYIKECEFGRSLAVDTNALIKNIGSKINSESSEYSPVSMSNNKILLYTSPRSDIEKEKRKKKNQMPFESIYMNYYANNEWSEAKKVEYPINKDRQNDAILSVALDGKTVLLYKEGDIYISSYESGIWSDPLIIEGDLNTKEQESSACFSPDMKYIYFSSRRQESFGGLDIFRCKYVSEDKSCDDVENIGTAINTPKDEDGMFIHADNKTMFFSSNGRKSIGGFDIFYCQQTDTNWSLPINMGMPLNSAEDDIFFSLNKDKTKGYFTSYRQDSYGEKDIYTVDFKVPFGNSKSILIDSTKTISKEEHLHQKTIEVNGYIEDNMTKKGCESTVTIINLETSDTLKTICDSDGKFSIKLESTFDYLFIVEADKYYTKTDTVSLPAGTSEYSYSTSSSPDTGWEITLYDDYVIDAYVDSVLVEGTIRDFIEDKGIISEIIFSSEGVRIPAKVSEHSKKFSVSLPKGKKYDVSIKSDNYFHQSTSLNTSTANNYIFIDAKLIKSSESLLQNAIPHDEMISIKENTLALLVVDLNIMNSTPNNGIITISDSETGEIIETRHIDGKNKRFKTHVPANKKYNISIKADGYFHQSQDLLIGNKITKAEIRSELEAITKKEKKLLLTPITFETNIFGITENNKHIVEAVLKTVSSKEIKSLEIIGYTDNVGTMESNIQLSEKRAQTIAQYFIENNIITKEQAIPIGKGEQDPISDNNSEEGRAKNRRVQLILTYME